MILKAASFRRMDTDYLHCIGIDEPVMMDRAGAKYYYFRDGLGSIREMTDSGGTAQNSYSYGAWGEVRNQSGVVPNTYGYTGREFSEDGLYFYRARYLDSSLGRFLSEDPVGLRGDKNFYNYVRNNPHNYIDPHGLVTIKIDVGIHPLTSQEIRAKTKGGTSGGFMVPKIYVECECVCNKGLWSPRITIDISFHIYYPEEGDQIYRYKGVMGDPKSPEEAIKHELGHVFIYARFVNEVYINALVVEKIQTSFKFICETACLGFKTGNKFLSVRYEALQKLHDLFE